MVLLVLYLSYCILPLHVIAAYFSFTLCAKFMETVKDFELLIISVFMTFEW
jgi:hypothetical protein